MRHRIAGVPLFLRSFCLALGYGVLCLASSGTVENIYWEEISDAMGRDGSALASLKKVENPALLSVVFDAEWVIHHGKQPTFTEALGRNFLFNAISSVGPFVVLHPEDAPRLHALVDDLSSTMKIRKPMIIYSDIGLFNAFAAGFSRDNSCIFLCRGMLEKVSTEAVFGIIAHELGHIAHNHTRKKFIAACGAGLAMIGLFMHSVHAVCAAEKKGPAMLSGAVRCFSLGFACVGLETLYTRYCERQADRVMKTCLKDRGVTMLQSILNHEKSGGLVEARIAGDFMKMPRFERLTEAERLDFQAKISRGQRWVHAHHNNCRGLNALFSSHPSTEERLSDMERDES